ncbi:ATP-binding cassette domain-containing protein [Pseudohoeflea coraliihabitans]|uniref:ATP-binding cassette domain-containing protein n=1 Tax=Pseudohoeflea coraliihabitans TaxID=2860393 RepID=A0ABS6WT03_9HYPH|nr:ATP-binding cassette domain-containing protein [Pseudohoeflea sp. DP4N28-3]MBW3099082.1 ATP-binding cassette domain-containing protein [Pseudohoeflea sp. DP4N28-3]
MADRSALILEDISIRLHGRRLIALAGRVEPGTVLTVMGPSGSGKSTLLAFIGGFLDPVFSAQGRVSSGAVVLTDLPAEERRAGILFQDPLLFPHLSVADNIAIAVPGAVRSPRQRRQMAMAALERVGLAGFGKRDPETLSGGQKARVALQRVLVSEPRLLLLDEPFSKLDATLRDQVREMVFAEARTAGLPMILVTHDAADAVAAGGPVHNVGAE